jgi:hypothetical protein
VRPAPPVAQVTGEHAGIAIRPEPESLISAVPDIQRGAVPTHVARAAASFSRSTQHHSTRAGSPFPPSAYVAHQAVRSLQHSRAMQRSRTAFTARSDIAAARSAPQPPFTGRGVLCVFRHRNNSNACASMPPMLQRNGQCAVYGASRSHSSTSALRDARNAREGSRRQCHAFCSSSRAEE